MSGGHFDYKQYQIRYIADEIEQLIINEESNEINEWGEQIRKEWLSETIEKFKEALDILRKAEIMVQRIDWLVCGDDGENNFHLRWDKELEDYKKSKS